MNSIQSKQINNSKKFITLTKIINNYKNNSNRTIKNNQNTRKRILVVYSELPLPTSRYYLNWVAIIKGKNRYVNVRKYKLLDMKKGTIYKMHIVILNTNQYEKMNKKHLQSRKSFDPSILNISTSTSTSTTTNNQILSKKIIDVEHSSSKLASTSIFKFGATLFSPAPGNPLTTMIK